MLLALSASRLPPAVTRPQVPVRALHASRSFNIILDRPVTGIVQRRFFTGSNHCDFVVTSSVARQGVFVDPRTVTLALTPKERDIVEAFTTAELLQIIQRGRQQSVAESDLEFLHHIAFYSPAYERAIMRNQEMRVETNRKAGLLNICTAEIYREAILQGAITGQCKTWDIRTKVESNIEVSVQGSNYLAYRCFETLGDLLDLFLRSSFQMATFLSSDEKHTPHVTTNLRKI